MKRMSVGIVLLTASATPAIAAQSVGAQWGDGTDFSSLSQLDGIFIRTKGPGGNVLVAPGWHWMVNKIDFQLANGGTFVTFNAVGYIKYVPSNGTTLYYGAYEKAWWDSGAHDELYYVSAVPYTPNDEIASGMWRSNGETWHYNWWTPTVNYGLDSWSSAGDESPRSYSAGGLAYNCYQDLTNWPTWGLLLHTPSSGWQYSPTLRTCGFGGIQCSFGTNPTWSQPTGNLGSGATLSVTASCP